MFENLAEKFAGKPKSNNLAMTPLIKTLFRRPPDELEKGMPWRTIQDEFGKFKWVDHAGHISRDSLLCRT